VETGSDPFGTNRGVSMKILVAEDNRINRMVLVKQLAALHNAEIWEAQDGEEALRLWETINPDILITDLEMPKRDGLELMYEIRAQESDTYTFIIVLTGQENEESLANSFEAGADDYLTKPFEQRELHYRIRAGERMLSLFQKQFVVMALAHLTEVRDATSGQHIERIGAYAKVLATALRTTPQFKDQINRRFLDHLEIASILHDIGKVGIDDFILRKKGKLTPEEWEIMKTHTLIGQSTIEDIVRNHPKAQYLNMAAMVARWHHERFDGNGYPDRLSGEQIPLCARIIALADVYDALVSNRPYKQAYSHEEAKRIILHESTGQFDPRILQAFMDNEAAFSKIALSNAAYQKTTIQGDNHETQRFVD
jgi:putative two-component system response regulator